MAKDIPIEKTINRESLCGLQREVLNEIHTNKWTYKESASDADCFCVPQFKKNGIMELVIPIRTILFFVISKYLLEIWTRKKKIQNLLQF